METTYILVYVSLDQRHAWAAEMALWLRAHKALLKGHEFRSSTQGSQLSISPAVADPTLWTPQAPTQIDKWKIKKITKETVKIIL